MAAATSESEVLDSVEDVDIDEGVFKYVLIRVKCGDSDKFIVRG